MGDTDLDGKVTIMDATAIQLHLAQLETLSERALAVANVDRDAELTIMDTTYIQMFLAELIDKF